jgi:hypothetical protein
MTYENSTPHFCATSTWYLLQAASTACAVLGAILLVGLLDGLPAHAASRTDLKGTWIGWSSIKITEPGFDFGGETFVVGAPTDDGWLDWFLVDGQLTPSLTGHLHLNDVRELCARMRMD